jgi:hypothetical protein
VKKRKKSPDRSIYSPAARILWCRSKKPALSETDNTRAPFRRGANFLLPNESGG